MLRVMMLAMAGGAVALWVLFLPMVIIGPDAVEWSGPAGFGIVMLSMFVGLFFIDDI